MKWLVFEAVVTSGDYDRVVFKKEYLCRSERTGMSRFMTKMAEKLPHDVLEKSRIYCTQMRLF